MKKLTLLLVCVLAVLFSCRKSVAYYSGTLTATVNGVVDTFNTNVLALKDSATGTFTLSVVGFHGAFGDSLTGGFESAELGFEITAPGHVTTGTYITDSTAGTQLAMIYIPANTTLYDSVTTSQPAPPTVVITKITASNVQGTFSGFTFYSDSSSVTKATITNGQFNVNIAP